MDLNGVPKWLAPHEYPELTGTEPVFTQIRLVKELSFFQNIGILVVQIKNWEFESIFRNLKIGDSNQDVSFMLVNDDGMILLTQIKSWMDRTSSLSRIKRLPLKKGFRVSKQSTTGRKAFFPCIT